MVVVDTCYHSIGEMSQEFKVMFGYIGSSRSTLEYMRPCLKKTVLLMLLLFNKKYVENLLGDKIGLGRC